MHVHACECLCSLGEYLWRGRGLPHLERAHARSPAAQGQHWKSEGGRWRPESLEIFSQTKTHEARQWKYVYTNKRGQSWLTLAATANIQEAGLSAGTEAFIGGVICSVGKQGFRSNEPVKRDTFHLARALVNQLQRSVAEGKISVNLLKLGPERKGKEFLPAGIWAIKGQCALLGHEGRPHLSSCAINHVTLRSPPIGELQMKQQVKNRSEEGKPVWWKRCVQ